MQKKAKKKAAKKTAKARKPKVTYNPAEKLTIQEEIFCQYYVVNADSRGNGTWSYIHAYGKDEEVAKAPKDDAIYEEIDDGKGKMIKGKLIRPSSYDLIINWCAAEASKLIRKPKIQRRKYELLNELLRDDIVDGELAKVILQDDDKTPKVQAIKEYNSLKQRTEEVVQHVHAFADIQGMSREEIAKEKEKLMSFYKKK